MTEHELVDGALFIESDEATGKIKGVTGRCKCGWTTGHCFSAMGASSLFAKHLFETLTPPERGEPESQP